MAVPTARLSENRTKQGGKTEFVILENWCKVFQRSLCVTRVNYDNIIEKQPTNRVSNQVIELTNI